MTPRTEAGLTLLRYRGGGQPTIAEIRAIEEEAARDALLALKRVIEQQDHDYALHDEAISDSDHWTDTDMNVYAATVAGVLVLIDAALS